MTKNVLFEIGLEELPARFIDDAENELISKTKQWLTELRITFGCVTSFSTPRRLAVLIKDIATTQETVTEEVRGPAEKIAKDDQGQWTKAAIGFTKGQGKTTDDIYIKDVKGTAYIFVKKHIEGKQTIDMLPTFKEIITSISFKQNMRWGSQSVRYARPIRWLVALYGEQVIPFEIANVQTGNITYGHRFLGEKVTIHDPLAYDNLLEENYVIASPKKREELILEGIKSLEKETGFQVVVEQELLDEVRNLIEYPTVFYGSYEDEYLTLPPEVLITSMKEHQRYFPVTDEDGKLLPHFVSVRNGDDHELATVARGNEKVLRARLADAQFFYEEDLKQSIDENLAKLERVIFHEKIGTISHKVAHIVAITKEIASRLQLDEEASKQAQRGAEICKFDLVTNMVNEFTELQGIIGEKYALKFDEDPLVAQTIREHYMPIQATGDLPETMTGAIVSVADKLDTVIGCISVGLMPTGSQDPYGLRRQTLGILRILKEKDWDLSLESLLNIGYEIYDINDKAVQEEIANFFKQRAVYLLKEMDIEQDVIKAVLHEKIGFFSYTIDKAQILSEKRHEEQFKTIEEALVRVLNLAKKDVMHDVTPDLFETASEEKLYDVYLVVKDKYAIKQREKNAPEALSQLATLAEPIHAFFENNMVMAEDKAIRENRLALVNQIAQLIKNYADLSLIEWKQHFN